MASVKLRNISKIYPGGFQAVSDLSLKIEDGEFLVMVGPSGCGKSTTLRMIAGLENVTSGQLLINDKVVNSVRPRERDIAMVFQTYALYPHMNVFKNMAYPLRVAKLPKSEVTKRVNEIAELLELTNQLSKRPRDLSGGQRQRVAMGRALVRKPQVFLLDEPLSNLDAKLRVQMRSEISDLQRSLGVTSFYVTHDQIEAMTMADRVAVIKDGVLQQVAAPQTLFDDPANTFVAGFVGSPPMNLISARVRSVEGRNSLTVGETTLEGSLPGAATDQELLFGIRPEHLTPVAPGNRGALSGQVIHVEALGYSTIIRVTIDAAVAVGEAATYDETSPRSGIEGGTISVRVDPDLPLKAGENIGLVPDMRRSRLFDPSSGLALGVSGEEP